MPSSRRPVERLSAAQAVGQRVDAVAPFEDVTSYPAVLQDIAVVSPNDVSAAEVEKGMEEFVARLREDSK